MIFIKRRPGESVVLETPEGDIVLRLLEDGEVGLELPRGVRVAEKRKAGAGTWLPPRPGGRKKPVA